MNRGRRKSNRVCPKTTKMQKYLEAKKTNTLWLDNQHTTDEDWNVPRKAGKRKQIFAKDPLGSAEEVPNFISVHVIEDYENEEDEEYEIENDYDDQDFDGEQLREEDDDDDEDDEVPQPKTRKQVKKRSNGPKKPVDPPEPPEETVPPNMLKCVNCGGFFVDAEELQYHNRIVHGFPFGCKVKDCVHAFKTLPDLKKHMDSNHKEGSQETFECSKCAFWALNKADLLKHVALKHETLFKCKSCDKSFKSQLLLVGHRKKAHENRQQCFYCDRHMNLKVFAKHSTPTSCQFCSMKFNCSVWLAKHQIRDCHRTLPTTSQAAVNTEPEKTANPMESKSQVQRLIFSPKISQSGIVNLNESLILNQTGTPNTMIVLAVNPTDIAEQSTDENLNNTSTTVQTFLENYSVNNQEEGDADNDANDGFDDGPGEDSNEAQVETVETTEIQSQEDVGATTEDFSHLPISESVKLKKASERTEEEKRYIKQNRFSRENKKLRESGQAYIGKLRGADGELILVHKEAKNFLGPPCTDEKACRKSKVYGCIHVTEEDRAAINKDFWNKSWDEKRATVVNLIDASYPKRLSEKGPKRKYTFKYNLETSSGRHRVCQTMFQQTFNITNSTILSWAQKGLKKFGKEPQPPLHPPKLTRRGVGPPRQVKQKTMENFFEVVTKNNMDDGDEKDNQTLIIPDEIRGRKVQVVRVIKRNQRNVTNLYKYFCSMVDYPVSFRTFHRYVRMKNIPVHLIKVDKVITPRRVRE